MKRTIGKRSLAFLWDVWNFRLFYLEWVQTFSSATDFSNSCYEDALYPKMSKKCSTSQKEVDQEKWDSHLLQGLGCLSWTPEYHFLSIFSPPSQLPLSNVILLLGTCKEERQVFNAYFSVIPAISGSALYSSSHSSLLGICCSLCCRGPSVHLSIWNILIHLLRPSSETLSDEAFSPSSSLCHNTRCPFWLFHSCFHTSHLYWLLHWMVMIFSCLFHLLDWELMEAWDWRSHFCVPGESLELLLAHMWQPVYVFDEPSERLSWYRFL